MTMAAAQAPSRPDLRIEPVELATDERRARARLSFEGVSRTFGGGGEAVRALSSIDLAVAPGDFLCVVGPSGCGKSTLLNVAAGFDRPTTGRALFDGQPVVGPAAQRGVVFQQGALFNWLTVLENVAFGPRSRGIDRRTAQARARELLAMVKLDTFADKYPYQLSGGMQQRVGIARALANDPELLLMDEPFAALDQQTRELLQEEIRSIWQRTGKTILWITHSIEEALFLATHIVVMTARPGAIKAAFRSPFSMDPDPLIGSTAEFAMAKRRILELLRAESQQAQQEEAGR